jgi:threonine dehydrogenase-like Zn-dependent dehydrogenase
VSTFMALVRRERIPVDDLVTHVVDATEVAQMFRRLDAGDPDVLQAVLRFPAAPDHSAAP